MKKSHLRNIIRESIKQLMTEQSVQYTMSNIQDAITAAPVDFTYAVCQAEAQAANYWTSTNTGCFTMTIPNASAQQLQDPMNNPGNYSLVDAANDPNSGFYDMTPGGGTSPCVAACAAYNSGPCATSTNPNCGSICYACIDGIIYEEDPNYATSPGGGWTTSYSNSDVCGYGHMGAFGSNAPSQPFDPSNSSLYQNQAIWWNSDTNADFTYLGCSYPVVTPPTPLVAGCTVSGSSNYDMYADGCEVNGVVDPNDVSCCTQTQPGGGVTPINVGPPMASNDTKSITPTPNPNDPQVKRMKDLAFRGKK
jgi:hypothetical protein